jgi:hypothetical protein
VVDRNSTGFTVKCENYCPVECSTFNSKTSRVSFNHCFTGSNCLTTAVRAFDGTIILTFNSKTQRVSFNHCETVIERNSTGFTVKCENYCPVVCSDGCCKTIAASETVIERNSTGFTVKCENYCPVGCRQSIRRDNNSHI